MRKYKESDRWRYCIIYQSPKKKIPLDELFFKFVEIAFDAFSRCVGLDNACRVFGLLPSFFMCEIMGYDIRPTKPTHLIPCLLVLSPKLFISLRTF